MASAARISQSSGIRYIDARNSQPLSPNLTRSRKTILGIADEHGEDHAIAVVTAITSSPHNACELYSVTLKAVSLFLIEGEYRGQDFIIAKEYLGTLDLAKLRADTTAVRFGHAALRMADRLVAMTQGNLW